MQVMLRVTTESANLEQLMLPSITMIGRATECQLKIASNQVSRRHCRISVAQDRVWIEDLGSANGTFIDGNRIPSGEPCPLPDGSQLSIGPANFIVVFQKSPSGIMNGSGKLGWGRFTSAFTAPSAERDVGRGPRPDATPETNPKGRGHTGSPDFSDHSAEWSGNDQAAVLQMV